MVCTGGAFFQFCIFLEKGMEQAVKQAALPSLHLKTQCKASCQPHTLPSSQKWLHFELAFSLLPSHITNSRLWAPDLEIKKIWGLCIELLKGK